MEDKVYTPNQIIILKDCYLDWFKELDSDFLNWCLTAQHGTTHKFNIEKYFDIQNKQGHKKLTILYDCRGVDYPTCWELVVLYNEETVYSVYVTDEGTYETSLYVQNLGEN